MRKGVVLLGMLSSALVVMGCSFSQQQVPQQEVIQQTGERLTRALTGGICDTPNLTELQKPIPPCEPLDIKPFPEADIKNIEDVVRNCKYQKGHFFYAPF
jgi:lipoprotein